MKYVARPRSRSVLLEFELWRGVCPPCHGDGIRRSDVFGTESKPDNAPRNALQQRKAINQADRPWWRRRLARRKHTTQEIVLRDELHPLCCVGGKRPAPLHVGQHFDADLACAQG